MKKDTWYLNAVFYQIYPQTFCDSDGDGIGDLNGIISKLDYLKELGVDALWLNPIFESPMLDAGYDVTDYRKIHPRYGSMADFKRLLRESHKRGLRVLLDLALNHTSIFHPWFQESRKFKKNKYSNWYVWNENEWFPKLPGKWLTNHHGRHESAFSTFHQEQVDLNFGLAALAPNCGNTPKDPGVKALWEEMRNVVRYWLDLGVDGFRCDVPDAVGVKTFTNQPELSGAFWSYIRKAVDEYGDRMMVAEHWDDDSHAINDLNFHLQFTKNFCLLSTHKDTLFSENRQYIRDGRALDPTGFDEHINLQVSNVRKRNAAIAMQTSNHDLPRPSTGSEGDDDLTVLALAVNLTHNTVPFIYYGDELGMNVNPDAPSVEGAAFKAQYRTPMQWTSGKNAGFSAAPNSRLYLPLSKDWKNRNVAKQLNDPGSVLNEVKRLVALRKSHPAFAISAEKITVLAEKDNPVYIYKRTAKNRAALVAVNASASKRTVELDVGEAGLLLARHGTQPTWTDGQLILPPRSFSIFEVR
jgi:maltose alpha-D-glucosyltransferase/alpha-amylase